MECIGQSVQALWAVAGQPVYDSVSSRLSDAARGSLYVHNADADKWGYALANGIVAGMEGSGAGMASGVIGPGYFGGRFLYFLVNGTSNHQHHGHGATAAPTIYTSSGDAPL